MDDKLADAVKDLLEKQQKYFDNQLLRVTQKHEKEMIAFKTHILATLASKKDLEECQKGLTSEVKSSEDRVVKLLNDEFKALKKKKKRTHPSSPCNDDGNKKGEERKDKDGDSRGRRSGTQPPPKIARTSQGDVSGSGSGYRHQSSQRPPSNPGRQRTEQVKAEVEKGDDQINQRETKFQASIRNALEKIAVPPLQTASTVGLQVARNQPRPVLQSTRDRKSVV